METVSTTRAGAEITPQRLLALDGLRGLAVAGVLALHLFGFGYYFVGGLEPHGFDAAYIKLVRTGWTGVNLFFILSGFLITGILYESKGVVTTYFKNFYARRVLRIFPAYYALLLFLMILLPVLFTSEKGAAGALRSDGFWYFAYLVNVKQLINPGFAAGYSQFVGHLWSLSVEEQFYLVWPAFVLLVSRKRLIWVCVVAIFGALIIRCWMHAHGQNDVVVFTFTPARMDDLAIGAFIALLVRDATARDYLARLAWPLTLVSFAGVTCLFFTRGTLSHADPWILTGGLSLIGVFLGSFFTGVILSAPTGRVRRFLSQPVMTALGRYSYAIYLIHYPVLNLVLRHTSFYTSVPEVFGSAVPRMLVVGMTSGAISIALAIVSWRIIELPFLRLKSRFPQASGMTGWLNAE